MYQNYFLYYEETDLLFRSKKKNLNAYLIANLKIKHSRASSIEKHIDTTFLRSWHYMWSMFYYNKKNFGFFKAFTFTINFLIKDLAMTVFYILILNHGEQSACYSI